MIYYGLVDRIKEIYKPGIYGRGVPKNSYTSISSTDLVAVNGLVGSFEITINQGSWILGGIGIDFKRNKERLKLMNNLNGISNSKLIMMPNEYLKNNYSTKNDIELLYGLFDNFDNKDLAFQTIMSSGGGSTLFIVEKDHVNKKHWGGENGKFNKGLYCEHPKDRDILIPLENSSELIKTFILEETLSTFESLGAKRILIEDITETEANISAEEKSHSVGVQLEAKFRKEILREKEFGKGTFDIERAEKDKYYLFDFPHLKTVIESRKHGNQTKEEFTENINLSANFDVNVLKLFKFQSNFRFYRKWHFLVEFFDKNGY